jgi:hypothetical protein
VSTIQCLTEVAILDTYLMLGFGHFLIRPTLAKPKNPVMALPSHLKSGKMPLEENSGSSAS